MKSRRWGLLGILIVVMALLMVGPASNVAKAQAARVPVLIAFDRQPGPSQEALVRGAGGNIKYTYTLVPAIAASLPEAAIAGLLNNPNVVRIEDDIEVHLIDHETTAGDDELNNTWGVKHIGAGAVHAGGNKGAGVKVGVLDSGIDTNHPDLSYDPTCSASFVNGETIEDGSSHGTHTAGTVAALDNGNGVVGVAPEVTLCIYKVLSNSGSGSYSDVIAAVQQAMADSVRVTNNSYGSSGDPGETVRKAFDNAYAAGVLHVAAAGNSGNPRGKGNNCIYPARWDSLIATAATMENDNRASFSSTCDKVELAAPGYQVYSTVPNDSYGVKSGTSMASPHVAGTAALVIAANPGWSNDQVRTKLQTTADDMGDSGRDEKYGFGLVDADEAAAPSGPVDLAITTTSLADGTVNAVYGATLEATGGTAPYSWTITAGVLPDGINLNMSTGEISGTPTTAGTQNFTVEVADGSATDTQALSITIDPAPALAITTTGLADGTVDQGYSETLEATGGSTSYSWAISVGTLPNGLNLNTSSGEISGTPITAETQSFTVEVTDNASATDTKVLSIVVSAPPDSPTTVSVASITYVTEGGKNGDKHLSVTIALVNDLENPVAGASVSIELDNPSNSWTGTGGVTGAGGTVTYNLKNAPSGCYTTTVTGVTADGLTWDGLNPGNEKCK